MLPLPKNVSDTASGSEKKEKQPSFDDSLIAGSAKFEAERLQQSRPPPPELPHHKAETPPQKEQEHQDIEEDNHLADADWQEDEGEQESIGKGKPATKSKKIAGKMVPYVSQNAAKGKSKMVKAKPAWADTYDEEVDYWYSWDFWLMLA